VKNSSRHISTISPRPFSPWQGEKVADPGAPGDEGVIRGI